MLQPAFASAPVPGERRRFLLVALAYMALWLGTWYWARLLETLGVASLWFLPGGLRFCCLFVLGWVGLALELLTELLLLLLQFVLSDGAASPTPLALQLGEKLYSLLAFSLAYAAVVFPLRQHFGNTLDLTRPAHSVWFIAAALGASALAASAGTLELLVLGVVPPAQWQELFTSWCTGDFVGIITLAPLLLLVVWPRVRLFLHQGRWSLRSMPQECAGDCRAMGRTTLIVLASLLLVLGLPHLLGSTLQSPVLPLLLLLPLAAVALRYNLRATAWAIVLLDSGLVVLLSLFHQQHSALQHQLVMIAIALFGLWLGGTVDARNQLLERLKDFSHVSNDLLWETDAGGRLRISGRLAEELSLPSDRSWRDMLEPVLQPYMAQLEQASASRQAFSRLQLALQSGTDTPLWVSVNGIPLWDALGAFAGYRGTATDISDAVKVSQLMAHYNQQLLQEVAQRTGELRDMNAELTIKEQHVRVLLAAVPVGVLELDEAGHCRYLNANGSAITGCNQEQAQGLHLLELVHAKDRERMEQVWNARHQYDTVQTLEFTLNRSNIWCAAHWIKFRPIDGAPACTIMVLVDSTLQHLHAEQLWALAHTDLLTGLPNRNLFLDRCTQVLTRAKRHAMVAAVFWIDLDGFKAVNDSLGHAAGDVLLQQVALRLKSRMRDSDTVARIGGDEFAVVVADIGHAASAEQVAATLVASLRQRFDLPQGRVQISASIGIALFPQHADAVEALLRCADIAMYHAKHSGKNRVQLWSEGL